jgi:DNA-directed RNA polymerase specialized sigma24 family protein
MAFDLDGLYRTTYASVVRFLYRKVWDADRAEDLAQEVFMRALAHEPEKPRSWVFAVAANIARDEARSAIRRRKHLVLPPMMTLPRTWSTRSRRKRFVARWPP